MPQKQFLSDCNWPHQQYLGPTMVYYLLLWIATNNPKLQNSSQTATLHLLTSNCDHLHSSTFVHPTVKKFHLYHVSSFSGPVLHITLL